MEIGSNSADSISTAVVAAETSVPAPPITPPMATASRASAMTHIPGSRRVGLVVDGLDGLAVAGLADDDLRPAETRIIEGVQRLAAFHEHVVGNVHHVVDGRDADGRQPVDEPRAGFPSPSVRGPLGPCTADTTADTRSARGPIHSPAWRPPPAAAAGTASGWSVKTAISRAMPRWPRQSGRLLVTSRSMARSSPTARGGLVIQPGHHQPPRDFLGRQGQGHVLLQPVPGDDHENGSRRFWRKKGTVPICRNGPKGASHKWGLSPFSSWV